MLGVFAELENSLRAERQASGVARAKALGKYKGGKSRIDVKQRKIMFIREERVRLMLRE